MPMRVTRCGAGATKEEAGVQLPQTRILAQAIVDPGAFAVADRIHDLPFVVTVDGMLRGSGDQLPRRVYEIAAIDEPHAAFAGIERYVAEQERLN